MISKIAIQGIQGCFHEEAARIFYGKDVEILPCANFEDEFEQVNKGHADGLIMAIENTVAGALLPNYALLHKYGKAIKGEVFLSGLLYKGFCGGWDRPPPTLAEFASRSHGCACLCPPPKRTKTAGPCVSPYSPSPQRPLRRRGQSNPHSPLASFS